MSERCRCYGIDRRTRCQRPPTQMDQLCDVCRCPHGGCDRHGGEGWYASMWYEDPVAFMEWFKDTVIEANECRKQQGKEDQDELWNGSKLQDEEGAEGGS